MNAVVNMNFEGWNVRHVIIDGVPHFVASDVAQVLGYSEPGRAVRQHCKGGAIYTPLQTAGGEQRTRVLIESDVLRLIVSSKLPAAVQFEQWLFEVVLPEIRKTGSYSAPKSLAERSLEIVGELHAEVQRQAAQIEVLTPKADAWDGLASGKGTYAVGDAAKMLGQVGIKTGRDRLFEYLHGLGWVYRQSGRWQAKQTAVDAGRLFHKPQSHEHPETGERVLDAPQVRVTIKGLYELRSRMLPPIAELDAA